MNKKLKTVRKDIDRVDVKIMHLLYARKRFAKELILCKNTEKKMLRDTAREKEILRSRENGARKLGLNQRSIVAIWKILIHDLLREQKRIVNERKVTSKKKCPNR